jgi:hypothetical protein
VIRVAAKQKALHKKIASLSALGAGALVAGAGSAEAAVIYYPNISADVGFGPGATAKYLSPLLGSSSAYFTFARFGRILSAGRAGFRGVGVYGCGCVLFGTQSSFLRVFQAGAKLTSAAPLFSTAVAGVRVWASNTSSGVRTATFTQLYGLGSFSDEYALFTFPSGPNTLYGWIHLSFSITGGVGTDPNFGPTLTIHDFAYDDTGAPLAAGAVPEPATAVSTGLAALALGAAGLRRWRKARPAA